MNKKRAANLHIRLPADLKKEAEKVIEALGLDLSGAVRLFFTQLALQQTLPFPLPKLRVASPKTRKIVTEAMAEDVLGPFSDAEKALRTLHAAA